MTKQHSMCEIELIYEITFRFSFKSNNSKWINVITKDLKKTTIYVFYWFHKGNKKNNNNKTYTCLAGKSIKLKY